MWLKRAIIRLVMPRVIAPLRSFMRDTMGLAILLIVPSPPAELMPIRFKEFWRVAFRTLATMEPQSPGHAIIHRHRRFMLLRRLATGRAVNRYGMAIEACGLIPASEFASRISLAKNLPVLASREPHQLGKRCIRSG